MRPWEHVVIARCQKKPLLDAAVVERTRVEVTGVGHPGVGVTGFQIAGVGVTHVGQTGVVVARVFHAGVEAGPSSTIRCWPLPELAHPVL